MIWGKKNRIQHPDWIPGAAKSIESSVTLYQRGLTPATIEVPMMVIPAKRLLRAVYGSNLRVALILLGQALAGIVRDWKMALADKTIEEIEQFQQGDSGMNWESAMIKRLEERKRRIGFVAGLIWFMVGAALLTMFLGGVLSPQADEPLIIRWISSPAPVVDTALAIAGIVRMWLNRPGVKS